MTIPTHLRHLAWEEVDRRGVFDAGIFKLMSARRRSADGREGTFYLVDSPDWVNVVPLVRDEDDRDCFIMVWQYRHGGQALTLEFPGGLVDPGESILAAAARELREETGYAAGVLEYAGRVNPNPAFMTNWCSTFIARDLRPVGELDLDEHEMVDRVLVPIDEIEREMGGGVHVHAIMVCALFWYGKWRSGALPTAPS